MTTTHRSRRPESSAARAAPHAVEAPTHRLRDVLVGAAFSVTVVAAGLCTMWPSASNGTVVLERIHPSFHSGRPAVDHLSPEILTAVRTAATAATEEGVELRLNSGWRSVAHQERLLAEAIVEHGSRSVALQWAATPDRSAHVKGDAVDVGPPAAASWLDENGARFGLCRTFANEGWHFELVTSPGGDCPTLLPDASHVR